MPVLAGVQLAADPLSLFGRDIADLDAAHRIDTDRAAVGRVLGLTFQRYRLAKHADRNLKASARAALVRIICAHHCD